MTYRITNRGSVTEMLLYDDIGEGFFGGISAKQVVEDLQDIKASTINVRINSPGGSVHEGFAIANALRDHKAKVIVDVDALAASIASYIAVEAADEVRMADNSMMMIHNAWTVGMGDAAELRRTADLLDKHNEIIVEAYARRSGGDVSQVREWMDAETWFNAEEARDVGLADTVTEEAAKAAAWFDAERFRNAPQWLLTARSEKPAEKERQSAWMRTAAKERLRLTRTRR